MVQHAASLTVQLMVYSGRPNPSWELSESQSASLIDALSQGVREGSRVAQPAEPGLGYQGFLVTSGGGVSDLADQVVVNRNVVTTMGKRTSEFFVDSGGAEQVLLRQAREHGHAGLLSALGVEIDDE